MPQQTVKILCFGVFREYCPDGTLEVTLDEKATALDCKQAILSTLRRQFDDFSDDKLLIDHSVLACHEGVLNDLEEIPSSRLQQLSLLPPVSGG